LDRSLFEPGPQQQPKPRADRPQPRELDPEDLSRLPMRALTPAESAGEDPLSVVVREMREAQRRIARAESDRRTQAIQQHVVAELDRLIEQAVASDSQSQAARSQTASSTTTPAAQPPQARPGDAKPGTPRAGSTSKRSPAGPPRQPSEAAKIRGMMENAWGELPGKQREQMLQSPVEEFLPQYESLLEDYFKRLATPPEETRP
jgi:hypothetical protein